MLTKKQKSEWLKNLKSGKYKQIGQILKDGRDGHCCLDVLAITVKIKTNKTDCLQNKVQVGYDPFDKLLGKLNVNKLTYTNDKSYRDGIRDYSVVIPIIEKLQTK